MAGSAVVAAVTETNRGQPPLRWLASALLLFCALLHAHPALLHGSHYHLQFPGHRCGGLDWGTLLACASSACGWITAILNFVFRAAVSRSCGGFGPVSLHHHACLGHSADAIHVSVGVVQIWERGGHFNCINVGGDSPGVLNNPGGE